MSGQRALSIARIAALLVLFGFGVALAAQDKYNLKGTNALAFAEFRGYEGWQTIAVSYNGGLLAVILGNQAMIDAYKSGIPGNGKPFPDGAKMAKIHWNGKKRETFPGQPLVPSTQQDVDFMVKDSKRFADSGGWGCAEFEYDSASSTFKPGTSADQPPQGTDAKCGWSDRAQTSHRLALGPDGMPDSNACGCAPSDYQ